MKTQYGVLAYRAEAGGELRILLITSRETRRWVTPRGNPMPGLSPQQTATQEAFEEAGLTGILADQAIGTYSYEKKGKNGDLTPTIVHLFPLQVVAQAQDWPERHERQARWFTRGEAAAAVEEPQLKALIDAFDPVSSSAGGARSALLSPPRHPQPSRFPMLKLFKAMMPREDSFFDMFARHAETLIGGADAMAAMFSDDHDIQASCRRIEDFEHAADDVTRDVLVAVRRSFITPFDRSAITALISAMDDAVDEMWQTAKAIILYEVKAFEPQMREMSVLAGEAARLVAEAVPLLRNIGKNGTRLHQITEAIVHLEGKADDLHEQGLKALFQAHGADRPMSFIVGREVYSHLERVLDRLEDVADEIQGIVIDHA